MDTHPKEQFVHHNAGHGGYGGGSYIDAVILRDDHEDDWTEAADSTLERRVYYCQNWRADVVALLAENGRILERAWYEPYGTPHGMSPADFSGTSDDTNDHYLVPDGDADADDSFVYLDLFGVSAALSDMTGSSDPGDGEYGRPNGTIDSDDYFYYLDQFSVAMNLGRNVLSAGHDGATASHGAGNLRNRRGLAGYEWDPHVRRYHVRHRVLYPEIGRWTRRDPMGYVDGTHKYQITKSRPIGFVDPLGLCSSSACGTPFGDGGPQPGVPRWVPPSPLPAEPDAPVRPAGPTQICLPDGTCGCGDPVWWALCQGMSCDLDGKPPRVYPEIVPCIGEEKWNHPKVVEMRRKLGRCARNIHCSNRIVWERNAYTVPAPLWFLCPMVFVRHDTPAEVVAHELYHAWQLRTHGPPLTCREMVDYEFDAYQFQDSGVASINTLCESACNSAMTYLGGVMCIGTGTEECIRNCVARHAGTTITEGHD